MPKYFFTGASGFIGSHFHHHLPQSDIVNFDLAEPAYDYESKWIQGDVRHADDLAEALLSCPKAVVIALAAEHKDFGVTDEDYFRTNEHGTRNICDAATAANVETIVFYSSVAVYGYPGQPSTETLPPNPTNPYGASKLAGERVLELWATREANRKVLIIRPTVVYGERNIANMYRLIDQINKGRYFHIGKGSNVKSIAYVQNLVEGTLYLLKNLQPGVHIYNYADTPHLSSRAIADTIASALHRRSPITLPYNLVYAMGLPFDAAIKMTGRDLPISTNRVKKFCTETYHQAEKILADGFHPQYSNTEGLERMVQWYQELKNEIV